MSAGLGRVGEEPTRFDSADQAPYAAALAGLPGAGPAVLAQMLREWSPLEAWRRIRDGRLSRPRPKPTDGADQVALHLAGVGAVSAPMTTPRSAYGRRVVSDESWRDLARRVDPPHWWAHRAEAGIGVTWLGNPQYPAALVNDPEPPGVLFWRGSLSNLARPCVAIVGTRRATPDGRAVAFELGRDLASAGVCVVSGLALGIDGAAHAGVLRAESELRAGPAGVAASGVDVPYPRRHAALWEEVVAAGVIVSETLPGRPAQAWRFPVRNRVIAGLVAMVVVVESHRSGGSLITAEAAFARGIDVRVVPGPVHSSASEGSNQLLYDGPGPVRDAQDVLDGLGMFLPARSRAEGPRRQAHPEGKADEPTEKSKQGTRAPAPASAGALARPPRPISAATPSPPPDAPDAAAGEAGHLDAETESVLEAVSWRSTSLNQVVGRSGLPVAAASRALDILEAAGMVSRDGQWWIRRSKR